MASELRLPLVDSVAIATDASPGSEAAFACALAVALVRQTHLTVIHVDPDAGRSWTALPPVRRTLERWGLLEPGSERAQVFEQLQIRVKKVAITSRSPRSALIDYLHKDPADLVVLATEGREGPERWLRPSVAESVAQRSRTLTLFVPKEGRNWVDPASGRLSLRHVLVPIAPELGAEAALVFAARMARAIGDGGVPIELLHVGDADPAAALSERPEDPAFRWESVRRRGEVVETILAEARERESSQIVMVTEGREGFLDALRGTTTEQVVRGADCPVLAIPQSWIERSA